MPALVDVPSVSAQLDDSLLALLRERVSRHGSVSSHPPVLIEELQERPGGVLARWCKVSRGRGGAGGGGAGVSARANVRFGSSGNQVDEDFTPADYRLQYRRSASGGSQYEDAYIGRDCEFLVLHLDANVDYLFRVCARGEGRTEWSPWSVPQTGYTTLAAHGGRSLLTAHHGIFFLSRLVNKLLKIFK